MSEYPQTIYSKGLLHVIQDAPHKFRVIGEDDELGDLTLKRFTDRQAAIAFVEDDE